MASATQNTRTVEKVIEVEEADGVVLTLTDHEALVLLSILRHVGGDPGRTDRTAASEILGALVDAGVQAPTYADERRAVEGSLRFIGKLPDQR